MEPTNSRGTTSPSCGLYKEGDQWKSTQSFGRNDLLVLAKVADLAHTRIFQLPAEAELPEVQVDES